jgi:hypothetical protein
MDEPLEVLLHYVEAARPIIAAEVVATWPVDTLQCLMKAGLVRLAECATHIACPNCYQEHDAEVIIRSGPGGRPRFFIHCPEALRVEVPAECLRQWAVNLEALGKALATALLLSGRHTALVPARLWRLGRTTWQGVSRDVLFARGLTWPDGPSLFDTIEVQTCPIVLVADQAPPSHWWPRRRAPVVVLRDIAKLSDDGIALELPHVFATIAGVDAENKVSGYLSLDDSRQRQRLRRQVKQEINCLLMDDQLVAAYREHKSFRKAAAELSQRTGNTVTKDQVSRAVERSGGIRAVASIEDSGSVVRTVASHRRDRRRVFSNIRQPLEDQ